MLCEVRAGVGYEKKNEWREKRRKRWITQVAEMVESAEGNKGMNKAGIDGK
jgi:hypothetical protein